MQAEKSRKNVFALASQLAMLILWLGGNSCGIPQCTLAKGYRFMLSNTSNTSNDLNVKIEAAYKENYRKLYFAAYQIVRNFPEPSDAARDIVSNAFMKALKGAYRGDNGASLYTFLYAVTRNGALEYIARHEQAKRIRGSNGENVAPCVDNTEGPNGGTTESRWLPSDITPRPFGCPERTFLNKEGRELVREALTLCTGREQAVFELCRFDGLTTSSAADLLNVSQPTAHRALASATMTVTSYVADMTC